MKRFYYSAAILILLACAGCSLSNLYDDVDDTIRSVSFVIKPLTIVDGDEVSPTTRTTIQDGDNNFYWTPNDTVGIYPDSGSQVYFNLELSGSATTANFDGGGWAFKTGSNYYSYYPFIGNIYLKRDEIPVSYIGQEQTGTTDFSHIGPFDFMYTEPTSGDSGSLHFVYNRLGCFLRFRLVLPTGTYTKLAITTPGHESFITKGYYDLTSSSPAIIEKTSSEQLSMNLKSISSNGSSEIIVYMMAAPTDLRETGFVVSVLDSNRQEFQCAKTTSKVFEANTLYKFGCTSWTAVPQSMGLIIDDWGDGGNIGGNAN